MDAGNNTINNDINNIVIVDYEITCGAGTGLAALRQSLREQRSGLKKNDLAHSDLPTWIGKVSELDNADWEPDHRQWQSRNNALIRLALNQGSLIGTLAALQEQFGHSRIGLIMGSSTSSIDRSESAYRHLSEQGTLSEGYRQASVLNPHAPGLFVAELLNIRGPSMTISTACSSSAKVFASAARWLNMGLVDAVLVGGADTLCLSVLHGFHALQLVSENTCKPFDVNRDGINIGEAAGFAILARRGDVSKHNIIAHKGIALSGYGESSDAHHMSHPHPDGEGARLAIAQALETARLSPKNIGYINLHGTASRANDTIEGNLISRLFPHTTFASSTKGWTGHTLGAAGIVEAIIAMETLHTGLIPGTLNLQRVDPEIDLVMSAENSSADVEHVMSNSFGFGGNNAALIFSKI